MEPKTNFQRRTFEKQQEKNKISTKAAVALGVSAVAVTFIIVIGIVAWKAISIGERLAFELKGEDVQVSSDKVKEQEKKEYSKSKGTEEEVLTDVVELTEQEKVNRIYEEYQARVVNQTPPSVNVDINTFPTDEHGPVRPEGSGEGWVNAIITLPQGTFNASVPPSPTSPRDAIASIPVALVNEFDGFIECDPLGFFDAKLEDTVSCVLSDELETYKEFSIRTALQEYYY